ncbi:hypothetical protein HK100_008578 [Physocladia obscura]|uniref:Receptor ligand binding region domain-containing protein n=1 Tax=Physocladia obscura TaxID=109957 RepID=A0AAD5XH86_9FUNG|nr:hypothetical protein HK100_008578 [Physocladia obscura]
MNYSTISLGILLPFSMPQSYSMADYQNCFFMSHLASLAIQEINARDDLLPNIRIDTSLIDSWHQPRSHYDVSSNTSLYTSSGYAATAALKAVEKIDNLVAVYGGLWSDTTESAASVLSQYKIPMCGDLQGSPALSNKNNYPYFFRIYSNAATKVPQVMQLLLTHWKVTRVALLVSKKEPYFSAAREMIRILNLNGVSVLAVSSYDQGVDGISESFLKVDARYILSFVEGQAFYQVYFNLPYLVGPKFVWIGMDTPYNAGTNLSTAEIDAVRGFILIAPKTESSNSAPYSHLNASWHAYISQLHLASSRAPTYLEIEMPVGAYDCIYTIAYGLDKVYNLFHVKILIP